MRKLSRWIRYAVILGFLALSGYNLTRYLADNKMFRDIGARAARADLSDEERLRALVRWADREIASRRHLRWVDPPWYSRLVERAFTPMPRVGLHGPTYCGRATSLFRAVCEQSGIRTRQAYLHPTANVAGEPPSHVVVECLVEGRWAVVDPLYGVLYQRPDGRPATIDDLAESPSLVSSQVPDDYLLEIQNYQHVTGINWNKIPLLLPCMYRVLRAARGQSVDRLHMPTMRARPRLQLFWLCLLLSSLLTIPELRAAIRRLRTRRRLREPWEAAPGHDT